MHYDNAGRRHPAPLDDFSLPLKKDSPQAREKAKAELRLAGMYCRINVAFENSLIVVKPMKKCDENSDIFNEIKLGKTKARNIAVNVIGEC